jgi:hypothetical protein
MWRERSIFPLPPKKKKLFEPVATPFFVSPGYEISPQKKITEVSSLLSTRGLSQIWLQVIKESRNAGTYCLNLAIANFFLEKWRIWGICFPKNPFV